MISLDSDWSLNYSVSFCCSPGSSFFDPFAICYCQKLTSSNDVTIADSSSTLNYSSVAIVFASTSCLSLFFIESYSAEVVSQCFGCGPWLNWKLNSAVSQELTWYRCCGSHSWWNCGVSLLWNYSLFDLHCYPVVNLRPSVDTACLRIPLIDHFCRPLRDYHESWQALKHGHLYLLIWSARFASIVLHGSQTCPTVAVYFIEDFSGACFPYSTIFSDLDLPCCSFWLHIMDYFPSNCLISLSHQKSLDLIKMLLCWSSFEDWLRL